MFDIQFGYTLQTFCLVLARVAAIVGLAPFYGGPRLAPVIRVSLMLMIAVILTPIVPAPWAAAAGRIATLPGLAMAVLGEVLLGAVVGMICNLFVSVFVIGGEAMAQGAGLLMAQEVDPTSGQSNNIISQLLQMVFLLLVVSVNGHLVLLKYVAGSFYSIPPQLAWLNNGWMEGLMQLSANVIEWGVRFSAPIIAVILIVDVGFALVARLAPDFDVLFMSIPVRLAVALSIIGFVIRFGENFFMSMVRKMLEACSALLT